MPQAKHPTPPTPLRVRATDKHMTPGEVASDTLAIILKTRKLRASRVAVLIAQETGCPIATAQANMHLLLHAPPERSKWWGFAAHALQIKLIDLNPDPQWIDRNTVTDPKTPHINFERRLRGLETKANAILVALNQLKKDIQDDKS